jgi:hypothetical protein
MSVFTEPSAMTRITIAALSVLAVTVSAQSPSDRDILTRIRSEGTEHSQAQRVFDVLTVDIGPRLTASPAHKKAVEFVRAELASYGLDNAHVEPWKFGRGWTLEKLVVEMIEPRYLPLIGYADGWSAATGRRTAWPRRCSSAARRLRTSSPMRAPAQRAPIVMTQPI